MLQKHYKVQKYVVFATLQECPRRTPIFCIWYCTKSTTSIQSVKAWTEHSLPFVLLSSPYEPHVWLFLVATSSCGPFWANCAVFAKKCQSFYLPKGRGQLKRNFFFRALPELWGGVYPCPNFLALFLEVHFWSIKRVYFFKNANVLNFQLFFRLHTYSIL